MGARGRHPSVSLHTFVTKIMSELEKMLALMEECLEKSMPLPQELVIYFGDALHQHGPNPEKLRRAMPKSGFSQLPVEPPGQSDQRPFAADEDLTTFDSEPPLRVDDLNDIFDSEIEAAATELESGIFASPSSEDQTPHSHAPASVEPKTSKHRPTMYCKACWRDDIHKPLKLPWHWMLPLAMISLGLLFVFWPYSCATCGTVRLKQWRKRK